MAGVVECPQDLPVQGAVSHNDVHGENLGKPFIDDFAQPCNNAIDRWISGTGHWRGPRRPTMASTARGTSG